MQEAEPLSDAEMNLTLIGRAYMMAGNELKRSPHNAEELIPYLKELGSSESALQSPRDGQDYVILWDAKPADLVARPPKSGLAAAQRFPVLAYEKRGSGGSRLVLQVPNRVVEMTDAELGEAYFPSGHKPQT
ncbi:hypothetical protein AYO40_00020 [Planctomycetaceae bacterium SCGC AG-212-D15]|nr:hypothetical protein AYO40_00020 [Planctomycetaceae bacterium SCGC AG-212-D15]